MRCFTISVHLFLLFHSCVNLSLHWPLAHGEHSNDLEWKSLTNREQVHLRTSREEPADTAWKVHHHQRRQAMSAEDQLENIAEQFFGVAKKVAITIIVLVFLCLICCVVSTVYICVRCCCGNPAGSRRKRNTPMTTIQIPQPVYVHSSPSPYYSPQTFQQPTSAAPARFQETQPMLPSPSAPPLPADDFLIDRPPPYEQICEKR